MTGRTAGLTAATLVFFAANSLLCRAALRTGLADAASFTVLRLFSGVLMLAVLVWLRTRGWPRGGSWGSGLALAGYALAFSFAYLRIDAGTGALVLFAAVQGGMVGWGILHGEPPRRLEWLGLLVAIAGLALLARPGRAAPDPFGLGLMALSGLAWAAYSLRGRGARDPLATNADNFGRATLLALGALLLAPQQKLTPAGLALAAASGAIASGLGYTLWYAALRGLGSTQAAVVQLAVPALAAAGGVLLLGESISLRLALSGAAILGGIALVFTARR